MSQRNSFPTRMGLGSQVCLPGWRAQRRSTSGWMPMWAAADRVLTHRRSDGGGGVEASSFTDVPPVVVDVEHGCAVLYAPRLRRAAIAERIATIRAVSAEATAHRIVTRWRGSAQDTATVRAGAAPEMPQQMSEDSSRRQRRRILAPRERDGSRMKLHRAPFGPISGSSRVQESINSAMFATNFLLAPRNW